MGGRQRASKKLERDITHFARSWDGWGMPLLYRLVVQAVGAW